MTQSLEVKIESRSPIYMTVSADDIGRIWASMAADNQIAVLSAAVSAMEAYPVQWDYIALELEKSEHDEIRRKLRDIIQGMQL